LRQLSVRARAQIIGGLEADLIGAKDECRLNAEAEAERQRARHEAGEGAGAGAEEGGTMCYEGHVRPGSGSGTPDRGDGKFITCRGKGAGVPKYLRATGKVTRYVRAIAPYALIQPSNKPPYNKRIQLSGLLTQRDDTLGCLPTTHFPLNRHAI
jgi:hypothetical protein